MIESCQVSNPQQGIDNIVYRERILWRDLVAWLNQYLIAKTLKADPEFQKEITDKLFIVVEDFGDMMRIFLGDKAADDYTNLFSEYIKLFMSLIDALAEGNSSNADEIVRQIYESVGQRAEFLSQVNPFWDKSTLENYIYTLTDMIIRQILAFTSKKYKDSTDIYNRILSYSTNLGDFLAQGIKDYLTYTLQPPTTVRPPTV
nr:hypothetical protein [uncultured Aminipila sp.]